MRILTLRDQFLQDVRYAVRTLAARPLFAGMAALSLALGIGANTVIYSFMDAVLMRALPVPDPDSLIVLNWHTRDWPAVAHSFSGSSFRDPRTGTTSGNFPYPAFELLKSANPACATIFGFVNAGRLNLGIRGQADLASGLYVSGEFFQALAMPPAAGRVIEPADDQFGAPAVAVLSYRYWQQRFGQRPGAVGESILVNNTPFIVIGVAAPEFFGVNPATAPDIYFPLHSIPFIEMFNFGGDPKARYLDKNSYWIEIMGRLRPGISPTQARNMLAGVFQPFINSTASTPKQRADLPALIVREGAGGLDYLRRQFSKPLYVLLTLVAMILAIACANIANLLLARAAARRREMAVRLSVGAGRSRIMRQLLTESVLLAGAGGTLGVLFALWGIRFLTTLAAGGQENFTLHASLNWHVLGATLALSLATGLLFGLAPAVQAARVDLTPSLKAARTSAVTRGRRFGLSQALVVSQIAVSLVLLVAAGLFVRTLGNLQSVQLGFNRENLLLFTVDARQAGYREEALVRFYADLRDRLAATPGVRAATLSNLALVSGSSSSTSFQLPGFTGKEPETSVLDVGPGFFSTMQIPVLRGREISGRDANARVAVVNEVFANRYFERQNPVGRQFGFGRSPDIEIIGVSKTARYDSLKRDIPPLVHTPYAINRRWLGEMVYELRTAGDPLVQANVVRQIVRQADPRVPVAHLKTQAAQIDETVTQERTFARLCTAFAALALAIACVGLYGSMAYSVARRTGEIGIRMALGAERRSILWMVLRDALAVAATGLALGLVIAYAASSLVQSFLFGMKPRDPAALVVSAFALLAAAVAAAYAPAWRASRIDPMAALREE